MSQNEPERVDSEGGRVYRFDDADYVSVTRATNAYEPKKKAIESWKSRTENWQKERDQKGLRGTLAHHRILNPYAIRELEPPSLDLSLAYDDLMADVETCEILWEKCDFEVGHNPLVEKKCWSHEHEYAGTFDLFTNGTVVDLKTSTAVQDSYRMQVAAYFHAMREMPDMPDPDDAAIIVLCPDIDRNPNMVPKVKRLKEDELGKWHDEFIRVLEKWKEENGA